MTLQAPAKLPMHIFTRGVEGGDQPQIRDGQAHWRWHYSRSAPMKSQNWAADSWTFSPTIMASTYREWPQLAKAYQLKAGAAAQVTPGIQALADNITAGISDRREQAEPSIAGWRKTFATWRCILATVGWSRIRRRAFSTTTTATVRTTW